MPRRSTSNTKSAQARRVYYDINDLVVAKRACDLLKVAAGDLLRCPCL